MAIPNTKLSDLNHDCLINILTRLNFADLFSAAQANTRLNEAAGTVFSRKYGKNLIRLSATSIAITSATARRPPLTETITIANSSEIGAFLRHFGPYITVLHLLLSESTASPIEDYLLAHCRQNVVDLTLFYAKTSILANIRQPFRQLRQLSITNGTLNANTSQLHVYFPQLEALSLCMVDFEQPNCIRVSSPLLQSLRLEYNGLRDRIVSAVKPNLYELIRLNKQLREVNLSFFYLYEAFDWHFYKAISDHLKQLTVLKIHDEAAIAGDELKFDNVEKFHLKCNWAKPKPIFRFDKLKEFAFTKMPEVDEAFIDALVSNRELQRVELLIFDEDFELSREDLVKLANLPDLVEFHLKMTVDATSVGDVELFARRCRSLQRLWLELSMAGSVDLEEFVGELRTKLADEWEEVYVRRDKEIGREVIFQRQPR